LCNPPDFFPEIDQTCACENWPYVLAGPLGGFLIIFAWVWIFFFHTKFILFVFVCSRWYGYRYSGFKYVTSIPKETESLISSKNDDKRVDDIMKSYGF
jgi:hypothetical protein